jgi:hypothetical protein
VPADTAKGELSGTDLVTAIEGRGVSDLAELWVLDPSDPRLVHGRWVLEGDALDRLHELHRAGVRFDTYIPPTQPIDWVDELAGAAAIGGGITTALYLLIVLDSGTADVPGWPLVPLIAAAIAAVAVYATWRREHRATGSHSRVASRQIDELTATIGRLRVRAPSPAAAELAIRIRTAWADATRDLEEDRLASGEWVALGKRVDELLYALALSQPSGRRPMRPDLLRSAGRGIEPLIGNIALAADRTSLDDSPATAATIIGEDRAVVHYPRYDPGDNP